MAKIKRDLPNNQYQAAINANAPTGANPFLTALDIPVVTGDANRLVFDVKIDQTGGILKGQAVYVSGADGTNILVTKADYTVEATSATTLGLLTLSGNNNALRQVVAEGILKGTGAAPLDTSAASPGDPIWLGDDGNLIYGTINEPYAPNQLVFIGVVVEANPTVGEIFVKVQNGFELGELHDVDFKSILPVDGEVLTYDGSTGLWHNEALPALFGASITPNLEPVIENTITDPSTLFPEFGDSYLVPIGAIGVWTGQDNNIATWDGTDWVYYTPVLNDITTVLTGTNAGNVYLFDGLNWILYASTSTAATPFYLAGSGVDAGGNKLATIARAGKVVLGQNTGPLYATAALSVRGNLVSENLFTRAFFCSTFNVAFVNTWFRVAFISINNTRSGTYKILFSEYNKTTTNQAFSAVIDISAAKGGSGSISAKVTVISHSEGYTLTEDNFKIYKNQAPAFGPITIGIYYRPTQPGAQSNFTLLNSLDTQGYAQIKWYNTNLGATITDSIFDLTNRANIIEYAVKNNFKAIVDPTINDDSSLNYWIGSVWVNTITKKSYVCTDSTGGAAIWKQITKDTAPLDNILTSSTQWSRTLLAPVTLAPGLTANGFTFFTDADKVAGGTTSYNEYTTSYGISIILSGTSGTANINVNGTNYLATFSVDLFTTAQNWVTANQVALNLIGIRVFAIGAGANGQIRFGYATAALLNAITITTVSGTLSGTKQNTFTGGTTAVQDHLVIPYTGTPYENQRLLHTIRTNFNIVTGSVQYLSLGLYRYQNDSLIGSSTNILRTPDTTGSQVVLESYTNGATDPFVTGGFYPALVNGTTGTINFIGATGVLMQNIFQKPTNF